MNGLSIFLYLIGSIMLICGLIINYFLNRSRFNRRNSFGVEGFRSFEHKNITIIKEGLGKFLAYFLIISGGLFILFGWANEEHIKNKQQRIEKAIYPQSKKKR